VTRTKDLETIASLDRTALWVELLTGIREQLIAAGWSSIVAQHMVLEMYRQERA